MNSSDNKIELYNRVNRLKLKAGLSHTDPNAKLRIDPSTIDKADSIIEKKAEAYPVEVKRVLKVLDNNWAKAQSGDRQSVPMLMEKIYHNANQIKDLASTFNYPLMQHFGISLREFVEKIDINKGAHRTIVEAHIDVMWVVLNENVHDEGDERAQKLKSLVQKAINKYS
ncbi:MAG: hypothetical protein CL565_02035 [Alphaproteobacteria bacterium]|nr:hypothetical protein [Alphaproteobacteria bacterium]